LQTTAGTAAVERYLLAEKKGRLMPSLETCLADTRLDRWAIFGRCYRLEEVRAAIWLDIGPIVIAAA
jgi:hypothetical protein